jgi:hypothetical protein
VKENNRRQKRNSISIAWVLYSNSRRKTFKGFFTFHYAVTTSQKKLILDNEL